MRAYWFIIRPRNAENEMKAAQIQPLGIGLRIFPTHVVQYLEWDRPVHVRTASQLRNEHVRTASQLRNELNLRKNEHHGAVSSKAAKRIRNAVNWLAASARPKRVYCAVDQRTYKFRLNFITLTLPSLDNDLTDHEFKNKLLRTWIERMRYRHRLRNYVWKVEPQENGNIHAHVTTDVFIHHSEIRAAWNEILISNGLMTAFADKHGHSDPNSTDVKSVKTVKNLAAYLAKYFAKSSDSSSSGSDENGNSRRAIRGRLWAASRSLSDANRCNIITLPSDDDGVLEPLVSSDAKLLQVHSEPDAFGRKRLLATIYLMSSEVWRSLRGSVVGDHYFNRLTALRNGQLRSDGSKLNYHDIKFTTFDTQPGDTQHQRVNGRTEAKDRSDTRPETPFGEIRPKYRQLDLFQAIC